MPARWSLATTRILLLVTTLPMTAALSACESCRCTEKPEVLSRKAIVVDCSDKGLDSIFLEASDWPYQFKVNETPSQVIEAKLDHNSLVRLRPLPEVPITRLSVSHNLIESVDEGAFLGPSATLEELDLSSNRLTSTVLRPAAFRGRYASDTYQPLSALRVLRLGRNALHSLHPDLFEHLPVMEELYLDFNPMTVLDLVTVQAISSIVKLKVLDLSNTKLSTLPDTFLHTPRFLERLDISGNEITTVPSTLGQAKELKTLILDGNRVRRFHNASFPPLPKLTSLSISRMLELEVIEDGALSGLRSLRELYCTHNPKLLAIDTYAMGVVSDDDESQPLTTLMLNNNHLSYLSRHLVARWDRLEKIALQGNPWSCDCINQWMVTDLAPILEKIDPDMTRGMTCYAPPEMAGQTLWQIVFHAPHLRCLDKDGNHPENDGTMLIGVLVGALLAIPALLALFALWRKWSYVYDLCFHGRATTSPGRYPGPGAADYSRAFYKRADSPAGGEM